MILLEKLKTLFVAEEASPGVCLDATELTAMGVHDLVYAPEFTTIAEQLSVGVLGIPAYFKNTRRPIFSFKTYVRGAGTTDPSAPPLESLFYKAAGMQETIDTGVSISYTFTSNKSLWKWLTMHFWYGDGGVNDYVVMACGCVLNATLRVTPGMPVIIEWNAEGVFKEITTKKDFYDVGGAPSFSHAAIDTPLAPSASEGGCLEIDSTSFIADKLDIMFNNTIATREVIGCRYHGFEYPIITNREPKASLTFEMPNPDTEFDVHGSLVDDSTHVLALLVGATAGNKIAIAADVQFLDIAESANNGRSCFTSNLGLVSSDDTEFSLIFT